MRLVIITFTALSIFGSLQGSMKFCDDDEEEQKNIYRDGYGPGKQDWGFYSVREGVKLFYWIYYNGAEPLYDKPLVVWLSGRHSSDAAIFDEIGPLYLNGTERPSSWVNHVNLMFVDIIPGSGFSYLCDKARFPTNAKEIGADLVRFFIKFYKNHPKFSAVPMYIFGGFDATKISVETAKQLHDAIGSNVLNADFRGIALQNPWISPIDMCLSWAPYLLSIGLVDQEGHDKIANGAKMVQDAFDNEEYKKAYSHRREFVSGGITELIGDIFPFNIISQTSSYLNMFRDIQKLIKTDIRKVLEIPDDELFPYPRDTDKLDEDLIKPVTCVVEELLDYTNLTVTIYNGQFDMVANPLGTLKWMERLRLSRSSGWKNATRQQLIINGQTEGYFKHYKNFNLYWINRAGAQVTKDNPEAGLAVLQRVTGVKIFSTDEQ